MLTLEERFVIRELYRKGISTNDIARRTGRDRKTIRQIVTAPQAGPTPSLRKPRPRKPDPYVPICANASRITLCSHLEAARSRNEMRFLVALYMTALRVALEEWLENEAQGDLVGLLRGYLDSLSSLSQNG